MNQNQILLLVLVAVLIVVALVFMLKRGSAKSDETGATTTTTVSPEGRGVDDGAAAAIEDVVDQFIGVDSHPALPQAAGPADTLTQIKGLGPKAQGQLNTMGISRFDQLAALTPDQAATVDACMGSFQGRLGKDQWVEQAKHLAAGDTAGFEAKFGKLGG